MRILYSLYLVFGFVMATLRFKFLEETLTESQSSISIRNIPLLIKTTYRSTWEALKWMPTSLKSVVVIIALSVFFNSLVIPFWIVYATKVVNVTTYDWGLLLLLTGILRQLISIPAGGFIDKYGTRKMIVAALVLLPFPTFFFIFCRTFFQLVAVVILIMIADAILIPAFSAFMADIIPREKRGRLLSALGQGAVSVNVRGMGGGGLLFFVPVTFGSLASGYIYEVNNTYPWLLLTAALILCLLLGIILIHEPEKPEL